MFVVVVVCEAKASWSREVHIAFKTSRWELLTSQKSKRVCAPQCHLRQKHGLSDCTVTARSFHRSLWQQSIGDVLCIVLHSFCVLNPWCLLILTMTCLSGYLSHTNLGYLRHWRQPHASTTPLTCSGQSLHAFPYTVQEIQVSFSEPICILSDECTASETCILNPISKWYHHSCLILTRIHPKHFEQTALDFHWWLCGDHCWLR